MQTNNNRWSIAAFRIMSGTLSIDDICAKVNVQPTRCFAKGELCSKRNPKSKIREENLWLLESGLSDQESLETHIKYFLTFLKEKAESIRELELECEFDIMCAYASENGQGGFTLDHEVLKELAAYPVDLSMDLYPPTSAE